MEKEKEGYCQVIVGNSIMQTNECLALLRLCLKDTLRFLLAALAFSLRLLRKLALRAQTCARLRC